MMHKRAVFGLAVCVAAGASSAVISDSDNVSALISNLDLTTFPNSTGPRRIAGKTSFADYGFGNVKKRDREVRLTTNDRGWMMSFEIVSNAPHAMAICFHDQGLQKLGDARAPSYNATSALRVTKVRKGLWTAQQVRGGFPNCPNDPPEA